MRKNFASLITLFIIVVYLLPFISVFISAFLEDTTFNPFDYARITDVDYKAVLVDEPSSNGKAVITERLTFDIHAFSKNNPFWELWRDLPESYIDGVKVDYKVNSVKQILADGSEIIYKESPKLYWEDSDYTDSTGRYGPRKWYHSEGPYNESAERYECVFFYVEPLYRGDIVFEIEYEMNNAALRYRDCSELYISLYSEETIKHLESYKAQILVPDKDMPSAGNYAAYTYGTSANRFPFTESDTINPGYHTFSFELDKNQLKFNPYNEYIEFSLISYGEDAHTFTDYASINDYFFTNALDELNQEQLEYDEIPQIYKEKKLKILYICLVLTFLVIIYCATKDKRMRKKHLFYEPSMKVKYFRDIPSELDPVFASNLAFCKKRPHKTDSDGYSALMLSLVRKGYIELEKIDPNGDWLSNNVNIVVKYKKSSILNSLNNINYSSSLNNSLNNEFSIPLDNNLNTDFNNTINNNLYQEEQKLEPLTPNEEQYFNLIVRHSKGEEISINTFRSKVSSDYENTNSFVNNVNKSITNIGITEGYFQKADYTEPMRQTKLIAKYFTIIGIILIVVVNFVLRQTYYDFAFGGFFILGFTCLLASLYLKKLAKKYILLTPFGEDEYAKWKGLYDFLNSETLMKERTIIELPLWEQYLVYATAFGISKKVISALKVRCPDMSSSVMLSNPYYTSRSFIYTSHSFRSAVRSASYSARSSSYGYGSFGGHGGYGRRRSWWWRWPVEVTN